VSLSDISIDRDAIMKRVKVIAITLAFTFVLLAFTAQPVAAASRYDSLKSYMDSRYDAVRGGYTVPGEGVTRIDPTYGAITIMSEVGTINNRPPPVTVPMVMDFVVTHQWLNGETEPRYGGFSDYLLGPITIGSNYRALKTWEILMEQSDIPGTEDYSINATANLIWINKTQTASGGFGFENDRSPDLLSTAYALMSIRLIDTLYPLENAWNWLQNETATVEWIESCKNGVAYMLSPDSDRVGVTATAAAVLAYKALDPAATVPDTANLLSWLDSRQIMDYEVPEFIGGFEEANGSVEPNLLSTYFGLRAMDTLATLSTVNITAAESFILNCQSMDGSFAIAPGFSTGKLIYSGYACEILSLAEFGGALNILSSSVDPNSLGGTGFEWRTLVIIGIIAITLVLAILAVRRD
jgi:prenyltransferase beta subunit